MRIHSGEKYIIQIWNDFQIDCFFQDFQTCSTHNWTPNTWHDFKKQVIYCNVFVYLLRSCKRFLKSRIINELNSYNIPMEPWRLLLIFNWLVHLGQTFKTLIVILKSGNFVYHHWECTSIYRPLSYLFRFLDDNALCRITNLYSSDILTNPTCKEVALLKKEICNWITNALR